MREMKDSGVKWIGVIPDDWQVNNPKYHFTQRKDRAPQGMVQLTASQKHGVITQTEYMERTGANIVTVQKDFDILKLVCAGDFVIHMRSFQGGLEYSEKTGSISSAYVMLIPGETICEPRYYKWFFKSSNYIDALSSTSNLVRDGQAMRWANFIQLPITFPPAAEQKRIADFLDAKCAEIDALTADIQAQIDTLEQYKRSVITETITKGLDPSAEMKDSGIDGAGVTPSHWKTTRLCYECYIRARLGWRGLKADEYADEGYAFISAFNIQNGKLVWTPLNYITKERFDESPEIKLHSGDVLIVKDGAGVGKCARVDDLPMGGTAPNSSIAVITPSKNLDYRYVCYYLQSAVFNNFVLLLYNGMGVPHLTQEVMSKIKILVPPLKEQMAISDYLDAKCAEIDATVEAKKQQLEVLGEYKKSLIFEYVTGKKEVFLP